jgi:predicted transposase/invertase (TIGR01784 family)
MENASEKPNRPGKKRLSSPHDMLFKAVFTRPSHAEEVLLAKMPEHLAAIFHFETLRLRDTSHVDESLAEQIADVVLVCDTDEGHPVEIPFILEHKSYVPPYPPFQIMSYQQNLWRWQIRSAGQRPTPIIPILFYHGREDWEVKPWPDYLVGWREEFAAYTPAGGCVFISLNHMPDEEIKRFRHGFLVTALLLMKHRFEREYLLDNLPEIFNFVEADDKVDRDLQISNLKYALRYLQSLTAVSWQESRNKLKPLKMANEVFDVLEDLKQEAYEEGWEEGMEKGWAKGMEKGIEKGMEKGLELEKFFATRNMLRKGLDVDFIIGVLEVTTAYVNDVENQLKKEAQAASMLKDGKLDVQEIASKLNVSPYLVQIVKRDLEKETD